MAAQQLQPREVQIRVHDGVEIGVALYMPEGNGPFPVLFAPSPYRYDNNALPAGPQFLWRETGPIEFYVAHGYVYATWTCAAAASPAATSSLLDHERAAGPLRRHRVARRISRGRTARSAASASPTSACRNGGWRSRSRRRSPASRRFDGMNDPYRASVYQGGILGDFFGSYWWNQNRIINRFPANGAASARAGVRSQPADPAASDLRRFLARALRRRSGCTRSRCRSTRSASGARSICIRAATSTASAGRSGPQKLQDDRADQRLRRQHASSTAPSSTRRCCCRSTTTS